MSVTEPLQWQRSYSKDSENEISGKIMEIICLDHQPLSVGEDEGFGQLMSSWSSLHSARCLSQLYQTACTHVDGLIKDVYVPSPCWVKLWLVIDKNLEKLCFTVRIFVDHTPQRHVVACSINGCTTLFDGTMPETWKGPWRMWLIPVCCRFVWVSGRIKDWLTWDNILAAAVYW